MNIEVNLATDELRWGRPVPRTLVRQDTLLEFVALADAPTSAFPAQVADFASRWGPLQVCEHGLPTLHELGTHCPPKGWPDDCREPLAAWRRYSQEFKQLLVRVIRQTEDEATGPGGRDAGEVDSNIAYTWEAGEVLAIEIGELLDMADVRPAIRWAGKFNVDYRPASLFGALVLQLAVAATRAATMAVCSSCGLPHFPMKIPAPGRRSYCQTCRDSGAPARDASRDYLRRQAREAYLRGRAEGTALSPDDGGDLPNGP